MYALILTLCLANNQCYESGIAQFETKADCDKEWLHLKATRQMDVYMLRCEAETKE